MRYLSFWTPRSSWCSFTAVTSNQGGACGPLVPGAAEYTMQQSKYFKWGGTSLIFCAWQILNYRNKWTGIQLWFFEVSNFWEGLLWLLLVPGVKNQATPLVKSTVPKTFTVHKSEHSHTYFLFTSRYINNEQKLKILMTSTGLLYVNVSPSYGDNMDEVKTFWSINRA